MRQFLRHGDHGSRYLCVTNEAASPPRGKPLKPGGTQWPENFTAAFLHRDEVIEAHALGGDLHDFFAAEGLDVEFDWKTFRGTQSSWKDLDYFHRPQDRPYTDETSRVSAAASALSTRRSRARNSTRSWIKSSAGGLTSI
jgi:hypothetical protein